MTLYSSLIGSGEFNYAGYIINIFIIFIFLFLFWTVSRWLVKNKKNVSNVNFNILNKFPVGMDKYLLVFEFNEKYYLMLIGKNHSELIDVYDNLSDVKIDNNSGYNKNFLEILKNVQLGKKNL